MVLTVLPYNRFNRFYARNNSDRLSLNSCGQILTVLLQFSFGRFCTRNDDGSSCIDQCLTVLKNSVNSSTLEIILTVPQ